MPQSSSKKRIVIIGGSFGGINTAYALRRKLRGRVEIALISREAEFTFVPSLPWVILGWRDSARLQVPLAGPLARRGRTRSFPGGWRRRAVLPARRTRRCTGWGTRLTSGS